MTCFTAHLLRGFSSCLEKNANDYLPVTTVTMPECHSSSLPQHHTATGILGPDQEISVDAALLLDELL